MRWIVRDLLQGAGTPYELLAGGVGGLGNPRGRHADVPFQGRDGAWFGDEDYDTRTLVFPTGLSAPQEVVEPTDREAAARALLRPWKQAWRVSSTDLELRLLDVDGIYDDGIEEVSFFGRPRLDENALDLSGIHGGVVAGLAEFVAGDAFAYGPARTDTEVLAASPLVMPVAGDVPTRRFTITVTGNGGTPTVTSTTEAKSMVWSSVLALGQTVILDFRTTTAVQAGVDVYPFATDEWFRLLPGANVLTFSGCAQIAVTHRGAYL